MPRDATLSNSCTSLQFFPLYTTIRNTHTRERTLRIERGGGVGQGFVCAYVQSHGQTMANNFIMFRFVYHIEANKVFAPCEKCKSNVCQCEVN